MAYNEQIKPNLSNLHDAAHKALERWVFDEGDFRPSFLKGPAVGFLYKIGEQQYSTCTLSDHAGETYGVTPLRLEIWCVPVKNWTPKGATLWEKARRSERHKFVNLEATRQYASRTPEEALKYYLRKRMDQKRILERQLRHVEVCIELATETVDDFDVPQLIAP